MSPRNFAKREFGESFIYNNGNKYKTPQYFPNPPKFWIKLKNWFYTRRHYVK